LRQTLLVSVCFLAALFGCARKPLTPATPWADVANDSLSFFTTSTDPSGLKVCYVFDWDDGSSATTGYFRSGETAWCSHEFAGTAASSIRVKARNEKGAESPWSPSLKFQPSQTPYIVDTIVGQRRWAVSRWYHASVRVRDPDGDSVAVRFVWDDTSQTDWSGFMASGSVFNDSCRWTTTGPHTLRVALRDKGCMTSQSSEVKTVNVSSIAVVWHNYDIARGYATTPTVGSIDGEPVLFCMSDKDSLDCYYLDGRRRWSVPLPSETKGYAPSLSDDGSHLYFSDWGAGLVCLDARSGEPKWTWEVGGGVTPVVGPQGIIYTVDGGYLCRVHDYGDWAEGEWWRALPEPYDYTPTGVVVGRNGVAYATGYDEERDRSVLVAVDTEGTVLWQDSTHLHTCGAAVIDGRDRILVTNEYGLVCFNPDGTLAWSQPTVDLCTGSTVIGMDDQVIITSFGGWIMAYDSTGRQLWTSALDIGAGNTPCVAQDSTIIACDPEGDYVCCIGNDGQTRWEFSIWDSLDIRDARLRRPEGEDGPSPVIGPNGDLYVACTDGLFCLATGGLKMANTAWPTYNHDNARSGWAGRQQR
jgi:outer membrane protein assembly factor BamB